MGGEAATECGCLYRDRYRHFMKQKNEKMGSFNTRSKRVSKLEEGGEGINADEIRKIKLQMRLF